VPTGSFDPLAKPKRKRLPRNRFAGLPLAPKIRIVDPKVIEAARKKICELCGDARGPFEVHHIKSVGSGGDDVSDNLINLAKGPGTCDCHGRVHAGLISRQALLQIVQARQQSLQP
jgi:hypothetical protein